MSDNKDKGIPFFAPVSADEAAEMAQQLFQAKDHRGLYLLILRILSGGIK